MSGLFHGTGHSSAVLAILAAAPVMTAVGMFLFLYRVGPRWVWASDACPSPEMVCGVVPAALPISAAAGGCVGVAVLLLLRPRGEQA